MKGCCCITMRDSLKNWLWVITPFALILLLIFHLELSKEYSEAEVMSPEFFRKFICAEYAKKGRTINPDELDIMDIQKLDDRVFVAYALQKGVDAADYDVAEFKEHYGNYIFVGRNYYCSRVDIPELASVRVITNYGINSEDPQGYYYLFLSKAENLRQIKLFYKKEDLRCEKPDESWQLIEELEVDKCPAMLIMPNIQPPEGSKRGAYRTYYAFLDENGEEIAFLNCQHSYDSNEI